MRNWLKVTLACLAFGAQGAVIAAPIPPVPDNPLRAQTFLGSNPKTLCPDLRIADDGTMAVVVFWLPTSGIPSHISIKLSSGSNTLDAAAINCVSRLRFAPATRLGDGEFLNSWQQFALRWADPSNHEEGRAMSSPKPLSEVSQAAEPGTMVPASADGKRADSGGPANSVTVHVCVDESGKLKQDPAIVHSSGNATLDQAAVRVAAAGSAFYRLDTSLNGSPPSGCAQLLIKFETK